MVMENVDYANISDFTQKLESSIEEICSRFSYRSIIEKALVDLCVSHFAYLSKKPNGIPMPIKKKDNVTFRFFFSSFMQAPHYIACFSTINSTRKKTIPANTYNKLRNIVALWLFLTEIRRTNLLDSLEFLRINPKTLRTEMALNPTKYSSAMSEFKDFFIEYSNYETTRIESILPRIFSLTLEDINQVDNLILSEKGFRPSVVLRALYALAEEWGEIHKIPEAYIATYGLKEVAQGFCDILIDFPLEYSRKILKKIGINDVFQVLGRITLTSTKAKRYVQSRKTRKRDQNIFMHSYPLWDFPLLKIGQNYVSHVALLAQCLQELAYKFITSSKSALARYTQGQHEKLVQRAILVLKEQGFVDIRPNTRMRKKDQDIAQFDIIAIAKPYLIHIECKTKRIPWRMRMFLNPIEMRKEGTDFMRENKLLTQNWHKKLSHLGEWASGILDKNQYKLVSFVVTDTPTPAATTCKYIDIIWIKRLEDHIRRIIRRDK